MKLTEDQRREIEALPARATLAFEIDAAAVDERGDFRVGGYMNTFGVMHSGRVHHPGGFARWKAKNPEARLPMLANHGFVEDNFATIGEWDTFELRERGMYWGGRIGAGTPAAEQARMLVGQRLLKQLSMGWILRQGRWVTLKDADLDPEIRAAMQAAEVDEAYAILDWYPIEGSLVDVADDPGARLVARLQEQVAQATAGPVLAKLAELALQVAGLKEILAALGGKHEGGAAQAITPEMVRGWLGAALEEWKVQAIEIIEAVTADPRADYAAARLAENDADAASDCGGTHGEREGPRPAELSAETESVLEQIRRWAPGSTRT